MFAHLHVHSAFSFQDGGSGVEALARRAAGCGYEALALTDTHGLYGAVRFHRACEAAGVRPILGVELYLEPEGAGEGGGGGRAVPGDRRAREEGGGSGAVFQPGRVYHPHGAEDGAPLLLIARSRQGFRHLCRIITEAQLAHQKGHPRLSLETLSRFQEELLCLSGGERGPVAGPWLAGRREEARGMAERLKAIFGPERFFLEVQNNLLPHSAALVRELCGLARELELLPCATNGVRYAVKEDFPVHDLLTCCRTLTTVDQGHPLRRRNAENYLKSPRAMERLFRGQEVALEAAAWIAEQCEESMEFGVYHFPDFPIPDGETHYSFLCKLCWEGARRRYPVIDREVMRRLNHELDVIESLGFAPYFLIMWDIVRWAREEGIRCAGRGSAADSIVTYVLGITEVDPIAHGLLFERFLNPERKGAPDIDIDFDANRRDEVIRYVYERYGREHTAMVCTVYTLNARSAVRELGKALDFPPDDLDRFARALPHTGADRIDAAFDRLPELRDLNAPDGALPRWKYELLLEMCARAAGFPRHLSVHLGGMVVSRERLDELVPLEWSTKGVIVTQWDKDDIEEVGLVKMDLLSLKNLSAIEDTMALIREKSLEPWYRTRLHALERSGPRLSIADLSAPGCIDRIDFSDARVYALLRSTRTVGIFQVESPGMRGLLGRLQPERFEDLVIQISLFRPGPLQADMITPFIARRHGEEPVTYYHPALEPVLRSTCGVLIFQEQVLEIASVLAGLGYGEADSLRRAMTTDRSPGEMEKLRETFLQGCAARGDVPTEVAERVWKALSAFAAYGFCKAHAVAFARTAYQTAWLKTYFPAEFFCGILNNQPMGFYSGHTILQEAKRMGIPVGPVDIHRSAAAYTLERAEEPRGEWDGASRGTGIRVGLRQVRGISQADQDSILSARAEAPFVSLEDFCRRTTVPRDVIENLVLCGAFDSLDPDRRRLLWELNAALRVRGGEAGDGSLPGLQSGTGGSSRRGRGPEFPPLTPVERVQWEVRILGLCVHTHPVALFRSRLEPYGVTPAARLAELPDGKPVRAAGVVLCRMRPPTRSGAVVVFLTLEDETGLVDAVLFPKVYEEYGGAAFSSDLLVVEGRVQKQGRRGLALIAAKVYNPLEGLDTGRPDAHTGTARREAVLPSPAGGLAPAPVARDYHPAEGDDFHEAFPDPYAPNSG